MSIVRGPRKDSGFYTLDKAISEDRRLSWAARGLLIYLLGKPDNWRVIPAALVKETANSGRPMGRDGVYALLKELMAAGYITRQQSRLKGGVMGSTEYVVSEGPTTSAPLPEKPDAAEPEAAGPVPANPTQTSIEDNQALRDIKKKESAHASDGITFDAATNRFTIPGEIRARLCEAYPGVNLDAELSRAEAWCMNDLQRRPKSNFGRFINGWMNRAHADLRQPQGLRVVGDKTTSRKQAADDMVAWLFRDFQSQPAQTTQVIDVAAAEVGQPQAFTFAP